MVTSRVPADGGVFRSTPIQGAPSARRVAYVNLVFDDGWLMAAVGASSQRIALCKFTKVEITESRGGRTYFSVLEGPHVGRLLSLKDENALKHLGAAPPFRTPAELVVTYGKYMPGWVSVARRNEKLDQQFAQLSAGPLSLQVTMNTVWDAAYTPLPAGEYDVLVPDVPHNKAYTDFYRKSESSLRYDQVWFPIKFGNNSRYVHVGNVSEGCVTVTDLAHWDDLHDHLISHRSADGQTLAKLSVKGKPERS
jgi:hypothetical protein